MELSIRIATHEECCEINKKEAIFNQQCGFALQWIYATQKWKGDRISERIVGMSPSTWDRYAQPGYTKNRSIHAVACFSWLSQVTMTAMYMGSQIEEFWQGADKEGIRSVVYSCLLPQKQFGFLVDMLIDKCDKMDQHSLRRINELIATLKKFEDSSFLMPSKIDLNDFKMDYNQSIGKMLRRFRHEYSIDVDTIARILNVSLSKYASFESPDANTVIPLHLGMRLKLGFRLEKTTQFLGEMKTYSGFVSARKIQELREQVIFMIFKNIDNSSKKAFCSLAREFMFFHLKFTG